MAPNFNIVHISESFISQSSSLRRRVYCFPRWLWFFSFFGSVERTNTFLLFSESDRRNVRIRVRSQLLGRDNGVGRLRSGRPLCSQCRFLRLHHSGPRQQGCGPPQVRITCMLGGKGFHAHAVTKKLFSVLASADGIFLSLKTTRKAGRHWFLSCSRKIQNQMGRYSTTAPEINFYLVYLISF